MNTHIFMYNIMKIKNIRNKIYKNNGIKISLFTNIVLSFIFKMFC